MAGRSTTWARAGAAALLVLAGSSGAQTLDLGPVPRPPVNTDDALTVRFMAEAEASASEWERAIVSLAAVLARSGDPIEELAARTIGRHLNSYRRVIREAERIGHDSNADPVMRQRLREMLARFDGVDQTNALTTMEKKLAILAELAHEALGAELEQPARLGEREGEGADDPDGLRTRIASAQDRLGPSASRLLELVDLLESVRAVPALETEAERGLSAIAGVVEFWELPGDRFVVRAAFNRLPGALERCLFDDGAERRPTEAVLMLEALARVGSMVKRCQDLEGDTARRIEPVLGAMLDRLRDPFDAEMLDLVVLPVDRSVGLVVRGSELPAAGRVSPQLQYAWRFLLPQEQDARVAAIDAVAAIVGDAELIASPQVVSALVGHAEVLESLEALLDVDTLQDELDGAGTPGAAAALEALRADLRLMGDRKGYREAGARVLPIVRTLARYRELPGGEALAGSGDHAPEWVRQLKALVEARLGALRVRLAMELIAQHTGTVPTNDPEALNAQDTLETIRQTVLIASDLLVLQEGGMASLDALPEFEWFAGEGQIGLSGAIGLERVEQTMAEVVAALEDDNAQRAESLLRSIEAETTVVGVLAELARGTAHRVGGGAGRAAMESALVIRRARSHASAGAALVELSLTGRYREDGVDARALLRYAEDQAERVIDDLPWLREAWQRRR
ncbi:MAG: hypothetical protein ACF8MJ_13475 [Phycisphaerales bacterium JB050]